MTASKQGGKKKAEPIILTTDDAYELTCLGTNNSVMQFNTAAHSVQEEPFATRRTLQASCSWTTGTHALLSLTSCHSGSGREPKSSLPLDQLLQN